MKFAPKSRFLTVIGSLVLPLAAFATPVAPCAGGFLSLLTVGSLTTGTVTGDFGDVCVMLTSSTEATVTFDANTLGGFGFVGASAADVNTGGVAVTPAFVSTSPDAGDFKSFGSGNVSAFGTFTVTMDESNASKSESRIVYTITRSSGTWASAASVLVANSDGFDAAAHVRCDSCSIPGETGLTFFVGETAAVPEPTSLLVLGLGLAGLIYQGRRKQA